MLLRPGHRTVLDLTEHYYDATCHPHHRPLNPTRRHFAEALGRFGLAGTECWAVAAMRSRHMGATLARLDPDRIGPDLHRGDGHWPLVRPAAAMRNYRGEQRVLLLIFFECLVCVFIWWRGVVIALGDQPQHRRWDMVQRQRRADWARNELRQRPV